MGRGQRTEVDVLQKQMVGRRQGRPISRAGKKHANGANSAWRLRLGESDGPTRGATIPSQDDAHVVRLSDTSDEPGNKIHREPYEAATHVLSKDKG